MKLQSLAKTLATADGAMEPCCSFACPVTSGRCDFRLLGKFRDRSGQSDLVAVYRCLRCGHAVTWPPIVDVAALYDDRGSQDFQPESQGIAHFIKRVAFRGMMSKLLRQLGQAPDSVLDFGCGSGQFTRALGDLLPNTRVTGSDFHSSPPPELADRPYAAMSQLKSMAGQFDIVIALHVLEHDDDPLALLDRIIASVHSGGTVVIEVPNIDCVWVQPFGRFWDGWYLPYHRHHFNRGSLIALANRAGLDIVAVHGVSVPTMGRTLANIFNARNSLPFLLAGVALHPLQLLGEALTNRPSAIRLIARKR